MTYTITSQPACRVTNVKAVTLILAIHVQANSYLR